MKIAELAEVFGSDFRMSFNRVDKDVRFEASTKAAGELAPNGVVDRITMEMGVLVVKYHDGDEPVLSERKLSELSVGENFFYLGKWYSKGTPIDESSRKWFGCNKISVPNNSQNATTIFPDNIIVEAEKGAGC